MNGPPWWGPFRFGLQKDLWRGGGRRKRMAETVRCIIWTDSFAPAKTGAF